MVQRFTVLDSWRGIAACLVALFHLDAYSHLYDVPFLRNAWLFVDFFFVLSGFIIAANYEKRLLEGYGTGRFLLLRLGRLYPLHFTMLMLFILFELLKGLGRTVVSGSALADSIAPFGTEMEGPSTIFANLFLVHSLHLFRFLTWNHPSWSISTELYTYIIFAVCLLGLRKRAGIALAAALVGGPVLVAALSDKYMDTNCDWGIIRCFYGFAAGVMVWHLYKNADKSRNWLCSTAVANIVEWVALALVILFVSLANNTTVLSIAAPLVFALVVLVFAFEKGAVSGMLQARPLLFLGTVSYSIYMTHVFVVQRLFDAVNAFGRFSHINPFMHRDIAGYDAYFLGTRLWHGDVAYVGYIALVIVTSSLTYRWIEKPAREWVRMRVRRGWPPLRPRELPSV